MDLLRKDVIVYLFDKRKVFHHIVVVLDNKPGALADVAGILAKHGINILSSFTSVVPGAEVGYWSLFAENGQLGPETMKEILSRSSNVKDVVVNTSRSGFIVDSVHFPVAWNTGERILLMRTDMLSVMFARVREVFGSGGELILYEAGKAMGEAMARALLERIGGEFIRENFGSLALMYSAVGWMKVEKAERDGGHVRIVVRENFECMAAKGRDRPYSMFVKGHLTSAVGAVFGSRAECEEKKCVAMGDDSCEFVFTLG